MTKVLIVYYTNNGTTLKLAQEIARGVVKAGGEPIIRTVPKVSLVTEQTEKSVPPTGAPYVTQADLTADGFVFGSPTRFGNMAASLKYFFDGLAPQWFNGSLEGKPAGVFTSSASLHGGQESTLLSMMVPLLHLGMLPVGIPFSVKALNDTRTGGSPYGATHFAPNKEELSVEEKIIAQALGERVCILARKLQD